MGWKMVRDKHQQVLGSVISGQWRISPDPVASLVSKLGEEYGELAPHRDPAELYDIRDALDELIVLLDPDQSYLRAHDIKVARLGMFTTHLEWHPNPALEFPASDGSYPPDTTLALEQQGR